MPTSKEYFDRLQSYLNFELYGVNEKDKDKEITLKELVYTEDGETTHKIKLKYSGKVFAIKLDADIRVNMSKDKKNILLPLFSFLDNRDRKWSKRCDFVVFNYDNKKIKVFLFEFKTKDIKALKTSEQLEAGKNWCRSLVKTVKAYTTYSSTLHLTKYVLTTNENPADKLDASNEYLEKHPTIRHYNYSEINGMHLDDLDDSQTEIIK